MINLLSDYNNGMLPEVLDAFVRTNDELSLTYGSDRWTQSAKARIREACNAPDAEIFFLAGGTQTNAVVIHSVLDSYQGVVAAETGHINVHESGAIEATGHKVLALPSHDGKMDAGELRAYLAAFYADENHEHVVFPGMVYITFPTELGTLYSKEEIAAIYDVCKEYDIPLFVDGARLGYGLAANGGDFDMSWLAAHCDVFYIGGTKVGAICGEAVTFTHANAPRHFFSRIKQQGALLAKGRLCGIQFDTLFTDGLYLKAAGHAITLALRMKQAFLDKGYKLSSDSPTNQQFVIIPNDRVEELRRNVLFEVWGPYDADSSVCRFVTSWATPESDIDALIELI